MNSGIQNAQRSTRCQQKYEASCDSSIVSGRESCDFRSQLSMFFLNNVRSKFTVISTIEIKFRRPGVNECLRVIHNQNKDTPLKRCLFSLVGFHFFVNLLLHSANHVNVVHWNKHIWLSLPIN